MKSFIIFTVFVIAEYILVLSGVGVSGLALPALSVAVFSLRQNQRNIFFLILLGLCIDSIMFYHPYYTVGIISAYGLYMLLDLFVVIRKSAMIQFIYGILAGGTILGLWKIFGWIDGNLSSFAVLYIAMLAILSFVRTRSRNFHENLSGKII